MVVDGYLIPEPSPIVIAAFLLARLVALLERHHGRRVRRHWPARLVSAICSVRVSIKIQVRRVA